jgi:hypothetical protein
MSLDLDFFLFGGEIVWVKFYCAGLEKELAHRCSHAPNSDENSASLNMDDNAQI